MDEISYQRFFTSRICDLGLDVNESMGPYFARLRKELRSHRILLWPDFYFGNEWGCDSRQTGRENLRIPYPRPVEHIQFPQLRQPYGGMDIGHAKIKTELIVVITPAHTMLPDNAAILCNLGIIGGDHAAFCRGNILCGV